MKDIKKTFVLLHQHNHGVSVWYFKSSGSWAGSYWQDMDGNGNDMTEFDELFKKLGLDYDAGEDIIIHEMVGNAIDID